MLCYTVLEAGAQGGTHPQRAISSYLLQKSRSLQLSIPGHSSAPTISPVPGQAGPSRSASSVTSFCTQASRQTDLTADPCYWPALILNAWLSTSCMIYIRFFLRQFSVCHFVCFSVLVFLTRFQLPSLVTAAPSGTRASREGLCPPSTYSDTVEPPGTPGPCPRPMPHPRPYQEPH